MIWDNTYTDKWNWMRRPELDVCKNFLQMYKLTVFL